MWLESFYRVNPAMYFTMYFYFFTVHYWDYLSMNTFVVSARVSQYDGYIGNTFVVGRPNTFIRVCEMHIALYFGFQLGDPLFFFCIHFLIHQALCKKRFEEFCKKLTILCRITYSKMRVFPYGGAVKEADRYQTMTNIFISSLDTCDFLFSIHIHIYCSIHKRNFKEF